MPIQFNLSQISVPQFAVLTEDDFKDQMRIEYGFNFSLNRTQSSIKCSCGVNYFFPDNNDSALKMEVSCIFVIEPKSWNNLTSEGNIKFPTGFLQHLATITLGTARGILFQKTEGTKYNIYHLPLLDVTSAIKEDLVVPAK